MPLTKHGFTYWSREEWGAEHGEGPARSPNVDVDLLVVHHSWRPTLACGQERAQEQAMVRGIERYHAANLFERPQDGRIGYHFLIFQSGNAYEGLGWRRIGAHTAGQNSRSLGVCFVIDGDSTDLTPAAWEAFCDLRAAAEVMELEQGYEIKGHCDFSSKSCPGDRVYKAIVQRLKSEHPTLRKGMRGPDVERVQKLLVHHGATIGTDGIFGAQTENAVKGFQTTHSLEADGVVGPSTWDKLTEA